MKEQKVSDNVAAERMGYNSATIIRMFRDGRAKVSFDEVPDLADAIGADRAELLEHALREYLPTMVEVLLRCHSVRRGSRRECVDSSSRSPATPEEEEHGQTQEIRHRGRAP